MLINIVRGLIGIIFLLGVCFVFSSNKKAIDWILVIKGILLQIVFAVLILNVPFIHSGFEFVSKGFVNLLAFTEEGAKFVFGSWPSTTQSYIFAFKVLPTILFFSALSSLLYYIGLLQKIVYGFAWVMKRVMKLSGAESLAAAANIFIGQTEAPLVVKPYLEKMGKSEIMCLMTGGMATIAGGVFGAYEQHAFATHLLIASIMSAPAAIIAAKILVPRGDEPIEKDLKIPKDKIGSNVLDAISNGTTDGLKLAVNVGAMLLVFMALMAMFNAIVGWGAESTSGRFDKLSLQYIFGMMFAPVAWLIGVPSADILSVGQLLGEKTILNEFVAYVSLGTLKSQGVFTDPKSVIIATYALCGFANFASIGIQIGGIGAIAPSQRKTLSALGFKSLIGGTVACLLTATIAGMLV
ncbi:UNVERIFIED_CONTAM: hypothetical protein GTU68_023188 [Idotea baltica]|nr:hypothetical protein [Idotea baltica]